MDIKELEIQAKAELIKQRDELFESLSGLVGLIELGAAPIHKYKAAVDGARELLNKYGEPK